MEDTFVKKRFRILTFVLGLSLLASACTKTPTNDGEPLNTTINKTNKNDNDFQDKLDMLDPVAYSTVEMLSLEPGSSISIIGRYADDSYWKEVEAGAKQAVADINSMMGYKGEDKIDLSYSAPDVNNNVDEQVNILDEELARYPLAVGIAAIDTSACLVQFDLAAENSIPIVTMDSGSEYKNVVAHVSTNNVLAAKTAASSLASMMGNSGEILIVTHDSLSTTGIERQQGFTDAMASINPALTVVDTYSIDKMSEIAHTIALEQMSSSVDAEISVDPSSFTHEDIIKYYIEKHPNLKAIYATNLDTTQMVANTLKNIERTDLFFVGFDGGKEQMELLEDGVANGLIVQNPYAMGYATVVAAARSVLDLGNEAYIDSGYIWVTKDNMKNAKIKNMLY